MTLYLTAAGPSYIATRLPCSDLVSLLPSAPYLRLRAMTIRNFRSDPLPALWASDDRFGAIRYDIRPRHPCVL